MVTDKQAEAPALTKQGLLQKLKALGAITKEQRNATVCALIGHSHIVTRCFGYISCARCESQIGDTLLTGVSTDTVVVGHNKDCPDCKAAYAKMGWQDKLYVPNPFKEN